MREMKSLLCDNAAWRPATVTAFLALLLSVCPFPALASFGADPGLFDILLTLAQLLYRFPCFFCISDSFSNCFLHHAKFNIFLHHCPLTGQHWYVLCVCVSMYLCTRVCFAAS